MSASSGTQLVFLMSPPASPARSVASASTTSSASSSSSSTTSTNTSKKTKTPEQVTDSDDIQLQSTAQQLLKLKTQLKDLQQEFDHVFKEKARLAKMIKETKLDLEVLMNDAQTATIFHDDVEFHLKQKHAMKHDIEVLRECLNSEDVRDHPEQTLDMYLHKISFPHQQLVTRKAKRARQN